MAISSIGVGSGLPLEELLADLRRSENHALTAIQTRQSQAENRLSAYGTLKNAIESLEKAAEKLTKAETYGAMKASVTGDAFTADVTAKAIPGEYSISVTQLATHQTLVTGGVESRDTALGTGGEITFQFGERTVTLDLTETGTSMVDIVKAINADTELGLNATVVNNGDPDNPYQLLLTTRDTGVAASVTNITVSGNDDLAAVLNLDQLTVQAAQDAQIEINDTITITSASNTIEDVIEGVTLTLNEASSDASKLSVATNDSVTSAAIKEFVTAYNALQSTIGALTSYDVENQRSSALTGDSLARRLQSEVRNAISVPATEGAIRSLAQMGITTNPTTGQLDIDDTKLNDALKNHMGDIQNLFAGESGLGKRVSDATDMFSRSDGFISTATDGVNRTIKDLERQYEITAQRIDERMENYRRQFTALDSLVAQMSSVSAYLSQQLSMLGNLGNDKK